MVGKVMAALTLVSCLSPLSALPAAEPAAAAAWIKPARALEEHAEDSIDLLTARKVNAARLARLTTEMEAALGSLKAASRGSAEAAARSAQAEELLGRMKGHAAAGAYVKAALDANQITVVLLPLEGFPTAEHREVALLDCLSREIVLLNRDDPASQAASLKDRRAQIDGTWKRLRPWLASRKGTQKLVGEVDACVKRILSAPEPGVQIAEGNRLGDLVDKMESFLPR